MTAGVDAEVLLAYSSPDHQRLHQFLVEEAHLLDTHDYEGWLALLTDDIRYVVPVRVTTARGAGFDTSPGMAHLDEDRFTLTKRVQRFATDHAWTEDPPSRVRHHLGNVRSFTTADPREFRVESALLMFRSRGDIRAPDLVSASRVDLLRVEGGVLHLARREVLLDESVLRTQNLAIFL